MQLYADRPVRRTRQALSDVLGLAWVAGAIWFAKQIYDLITVLVGPGETLERSGADLAESMRSAQGALDDVPLAGDALATPFGSAAEAANAIARAGQDAQDAVRKIALIVAVVLAAGAVILALVYWIRPRLRWMNRVRTARTVLADRDGADLLALRALATQPLRQLATVAGDGVLDRWRRGDYETIRALAALELGDLGLDARRLPVLR